MATFFHDTSPKARETKETMNLWDVIKIKIFCTAKETVQTAKRQPTQWEKISANATTDESLKSKLYKELLKLNTQETNNQIKKWAEYMNRHFSSEDVQMVNRHMKKCTQSLAIREIQINTTLRYHLTTVRMAKMDKAGNNICWRGCGERQSLFHCWWE